MPDAAPLAGPAPDLRLHLLGGFRAVVGGRAVAAGAWRLRKAATLVKQLALAPGHRLHREQVLDALWPELDPAAATNNLDRTVYAARRTLAPTADRSAYLARDGEMLALRAPGQLWVDVAAFEQAAAVADHRQAADACEAALALYAGDLLPEDAYADWAADRREALRRTHLALLMQLSELAEAGGEPARAVAALARVVSAEPAHEAAHRALMRLYARAGQRHAALRQYQRLVEVLRREVDAEPEAASRQLHDAILAGQFAAEDAGTQGHREAGTPGRREADPSRSASPRPGVPASLLPRFADRRLGDDRAPVVNAPATNLPAALSSFIGRERELAEVERLLRATRLLTLTGAGGVGKTRLAIQVAAGQVGAYPNGVWLVELAALTSTDLVPRTVARVLGVLEQSGQALAETLAAWLMEKRLLLVLDNCEHLVDACAVLAEALLRASPGLTVLATSRERLGVAGEVVWRVPSLSLPPAGAADLVERVRRAEASRLFVERAMAVRPDFTLTPANAAAVAEVCRRLDGIPLAIELAAARVRVLPVEELARRLDDRFRLLTGGSRTAPSRQQTLQAAIDWSYALLEEDERILLRRLSVFAGGFTLDAAETVCGAEENGGSIASPLDVLTRLVDKSLVLAEETEAGEGRYRLQETVRQYAWERLLEAGELMAAQRRHVAWCLALAARAEPELEGADQLGWLARLEAEHDNLRAALAWSLDGDPAAGVRLAGSLWYFWARRSHYAEGERWLDNLLARAPEPTAARAKALLGAAILARSQARKDIARARFEEALPLCRALGDRRLLALALRELGYLLPELGDRARGRALLEEGLALVRAAGDDHGVGVTLFILATVAAQDGGYARARGLSEESLAVLRRVGDRGMVARALNGMGLIALHEGDCERARALWEEALPLLQELGAPGNIAVIRVRLGWAALWQGDTERAEGQYEAARTLAQRHELRTSLAHAFGGLGRVAQVRGESARATALLTESLAIYTERGVTQGIGEAQYGLGLAARDQGDAARATDWLRASLAVRRATDDRPGIATCLEGLATVAAGQGQPVRTARLLGAAEALRRAIGSPMPLVERPAFEAAVRVARVALGEHAFTATWTAGQAMTLEEAVAVALAVE